MPSLAPSSKSSKTLESQADAQAPTEGLPSLFESYLLLKRIAKGGMGEVFLATMAGAIDGAERPCVVKVIREEHAEDSSFVARFLDEARIQSQLEHPGVVRVVNASHDGRGKPYVVLEHVEGRNLSEVRLRVQQLGLRLGWPDAVAMALGLCEALAHIHERTDAIGRPLEIVHRDLSPQNVMIAYSGDVKLIDFGTARGQNRKCHTVSGIVFAKPGYVAPEVANNRPGGIPADLYAVGIMLWELLAGRRFIAGDAAEHLAQVAAGAKTVTSVAELTNAPPELDLICQKLTATNIDERYESAREAATDLIALLKRAPSAADGQRSVRVRVSQLMQKLYPAEPTRTRAEFQRLVAEARAIEPKASALVPPPSPPPPPVAEEACPLLPGTRYELSDVIGQGASGVVYSATHVDLARPVAIKLFNVQGKVSPESLENFRREARLSAQLSHDNIVRVHDFGTTSDGQVFLAMERLEGQSLDQHLLHHGALEYRSALLLSLQICRALEVAHEQGVLHGDIKPQNLFLTRKGTLKLLDFGVSALYLEKQKLATSEAPSQSESSQDSIDEGAFSLKGTLEYLAPEQLRGGVASQASDQYALGVVLYEMLTATRPHEAESLGLLLGAKLSRSVSAPGTRVPQGRLPKSVDKLCVKLLASEPSHRYGSMAEVRTAIESILSATSLSRKVPGRSMRYAAASVLMAFGVAVAVAGSTPLRTAVVQLPERAVSLTNGADASGSIPLLRRANGQVSHTLGQAVATLDSDAQKDSASPPAEPERLELAAASDSSGIADSDVEGASSLEPEPSSVNQDVTAIAQALKNNKPVLALDLARKQAKSGNHSAEFYRSWVEAASRTRAWGEAHRAAKRLVATEDSAKNVIFLAQLEKRMGRNEAARRTLSRLLAKSPQNAEAKALLSRIGGAQRIALR